MASLIKSLAEVGFKGQGSFRTGQCQKCEKTTEIWWWRGRWLCDECVFETITTALPPAPVKERVL